MRPVSQTVKDVVQTLVDDNLVELDKIGISNCEWIYYVILEIISLAVRSLLEFPERPRLCRTHFHLGTLRTTSTFRIVASEQNHQL